MINHYWNSSPKNESLIRLMFAAIIVVSGALIVGDLWAGISAAFGLIIVLVLI